MEFAPFFSTRSAHAEPVASHKWRPALPPIDRPITELVGRSVEARQEPVHGSSAPTVDKRDGRR